MILADFVTKRLRFLGLMPYEFSRKVGLSVGNVVEIVSGRKIHVTTRAAERFCRVLGCDMELFITNNWIRDRKKPVGKPLSEVFSDYSDEECGKLRENVLFPGMEV